MVIYRRPVSDRHIHVFNEDGLFTNIFAYADYMVLLALSWRALQYLINKLADFAF